MNSPTFSVPKSYVPPFPHCPMFISGSQKPRRLILYGFSSGSLLAIKSAAVLLPVEVGLNWIVNSVDWPGRTGVTGAWLTVNISQSVSSSSSMPMPMIFKGVCPRFLRVKVL